MRVSNRAGQHQARNPCVHSSRTTRLLSYSDGRTATFRTAAQTAQHVASNGRSNRYQAQYPYSRRVERHCVAPPEVPLVPLVLQTQPGLSDLVTVNTGPLETIVWKVVLDMLLPLTCLLVLQRAVDWAGEQASAAIKQRMQGEGDFSVELRKQSTIAALVLLAMRAPATFVLPPLCVAYTVRTALNIVDLMVHRSKPELPALLEIFVTHISQQLIPLDSIFAKLLKVTGILFTTWFLIQLKDILMREIIIFQAIRRGRKELERVYLPLSTLATWAAILASGVTILSSIGFSLQPLLAVGGAGGIAAGFASQQVLTNIVSGINIFLTRPFVVGDQVQLVGAAAENIEGFVERVEIMRTLVRTTEGTVVAVPNKTVAELAVFNRTRALAALTEDAAVAAAAAAPLRRVLCFHVQLKRDSEPLIDDVMTDVKEFLVDQGKDQLKDEGIVTVSDSDSESESDDEAEGGTTNSSGNGSGSSKGRTEKLAGFDQATAPGHHEGSKAAVAAGATAAAAAKQAVDSALAVVAGSAALIAEEDELIKDKDEEVEEAAEEAQQILVSITLSKLTAEHVMLFVRCEMVLPATTSADATEQQTKATLLGVSGLVREKYGGVLLW